jgi:isopropylmalate/homocitrate/citramalate synthase
LITFVNLGGMPSIHFLDVTNRDGVQTARTGLSKFGKVMVNFYLGRLGVAQSEIGFPFLFHEVPYVRACLALAEAGALGDLRLSGWCRAVPADVEAAVAVRAGQRDDSGLRHYNLSISTSDQMIAHKFRGKLDRSAIINEMTASVAVARAAGAKTIGVNAEDGSRTDDGYLLEFALAAKEAGFGVADTAVIGDPVDLSWARRFGLWAAYAFGQPLPPAWPGVGRNAFAHESGIHADGALKDRGNYELYDESELGPFPADWFAREGRVVLTGEYGGKAGFRHVLDGLGAEVAPDTEDLVFSLVQLCASATGKPLTDDELRLIAGYPQELALLFPGQLPG